MSGHKPKEHPRVNRMDRAKLGVPDACPECGGKLQPVFGAVIGDDNIKRPFLDPTAALCRDCGTLFRTIPYHDR